MNPLSILEGLYIYRSGCGEASKLVTTFAEYHILVCTKIAILVNVFLGGPVIKADFKNSRISTTVAIIYLLHICYKGSRGIAFHNYRMAQPT